MTDRTPQTDAPERPRGIRGRHVVVATLSLFIIVPVISILIAPRLSSGDKTLTLDYDQRDRWFTQPVRPRPLEYDKFVAGETGKRYRKTDLVIDPDVEQVLQRCARLAQADDFFGNEAARDELRQLAEQEANGFYPAYLLASWARANDNTAEHDRWTRVAFDRAESALAQRLVDEDGRPAAGYRLPPVAIGYDRVIDGRRNATLVLIYPAPTSDARGTVYLPTYRSIYRLTDPAAPIGADPGVHPRMLTLLPQPIDGPVPNWFSVPDGAVGRFDEAVVPAQ